MSDQYFQYESIWPFWNGQTAFEHNFDYWTSDNTNAQHPRITSAPTTNNIQTSSHWLRDASYLRLKNAQLSYYIPNLFKEKVESVKIYISGQNLLTWSNLNNFGIDPETTNSKGNNYPQQKVYSLGINVAF